MFFPNTFVITLHVQSPARYGYYVGEWDQKYADELIEVSKGFKKKYDERETDGKGLNKFDGKKQKLFVRNIVYFLEMDVPDHKADTEVHIKLTEKEGFEAGYLLIVAWRTKVFSSESNNKWTKRRRYGMFVIRYPRNGGA